MHQITRGILNVFAWGLLRLLDTMYLEYILAMIENSTWWPCKNEKEVISASKGRDFVKILLSLQAPVRKAISLLFGTHF